jgi:hypothetical protein
MNFKAGVRAARIIDVVYARRPSKPSQPPPVPLGLQALSELRRAEGDELPFLSKGELATPRHDEPTPVPEPLRIEPPDWEAEAAERGEGG